MGSQKKLNDQLDVIFGNTWGKYVVYAITIILVIIVINNVAGGNPQVGEIWVITCDDYVPTDEQGAKEYVNAISSGGSYGALDYMYKHSHGMTHLFAGDDVEIIQWTSSGFLVRKLSTGETAVVLKEHMRPIK